MNIFQQVFVSANPKACQLVKSSENENENVPGKTGPLSLTESNQTKSSNQAQKGNMKPPKKALPKKVAQVESLTNIKSINLNTKPKVDFKPAQKASTSIAVNKTQNSTIPAPKQKEETTRAHIPDDISRPTNKMIASSSIPASKMMSTIPKKNKNPSKNPSVKKNEEPEKNYIKEKNGDSSIDNSEMISQISELEKTYEKMNEKLMDLTDSYNKILKQNEKVSARNFELEMEIQRMKDAARESNKRIIEMKQDFESKSEEREESWEFRVNELMMELETLKSHK